MSSSKHSAKLQRFRGDEGSAVVEFTLIAVPFVFLAALQLSWLADVIERAELRAVAIEAARYAALADVTLAKASEHLNLGISKFRGATGQVSVGTQAEVQLSFPSNQLLNLGARRVEVAAFAQIELTS